MKLSELIIKLTNEYNKNGDHVVLVRDYNGDLDDIGQLMAMHDDQDRVHKYILISDNEAFELSCSHQDDDNE